jgi:two-component system, NtrC family, sensor histidine kinase KinB
MLNVVFLVVGIAGLAIGLFSYWQSRILKKHLKEREDEVNHRVYELAILKELGDRIGYSLDVEQIIDIITGSLGQFIKYCVVSYMLLEPEKVVFKAHLEKSIHRKFIDDIRRRMLDSLSALTNKDFASNQVEEVLSGAVLIEDIYEPVRSFFNIPLVIGGRVVGVLTIAHTNAGLYKEEEMTILYRIIQQASTAVTRLKDVVATEQMKVNSMVQSMSEGVVMTDKDYRIVVANSVAKKAAGLNEDNDATIFDFIDGLGDKFAILGRLEESVKLGKNIEVQEVLLGDKFFKINISPVKSIFGAAKGEILGGVVIFRNITHDKEVEKLKDDFTSMMVHELRSPLDGIKKRIEVLREKKGKKSKKEQDEMTKVIYNNSSSMLELVNDLLDAAKIESGKFDLHKELSDIKQVIKERVSFYDILAKDAEVKLISQFSDNLPGKAEFDYFRIEQVINNLISNAIKFTESGGSIAVQALLHEKGKDIMKKAEDAGIRWLLSSSSGEDIIGAPDSLLVAVTDNGIGIDEKNISELFNKFKQFMNPASNKERKGTGLGLVIAKGIVKEHGGIIGVASKKGVGSTFYFTIPINK